MKITNKDVIQSYLLTSARYDYSVYEKRILYRLVQICQPQLKGQKLDSSFKIDKDLFNGYWIKLPISSFLKSEDDKNHSLIKKALRDLREKVFEYEDDKRWELISIIESPAIEKYGEFVEFRVHPKIYDAIFDFSKGFRKYELKTAMEFESVYTMRFYELFSEKKEPISYAIESLKIMFKIVGKYKLPADFIRYVIKPAKKELDKSAPYSFEFATEKTGRKITHIKFYPVYIPENRDPLVEENKLKKQVSPYWELSPMVIQYLKQNYGFTTKEINSHTELLKVAEKDLDLMLFASDLKAKANQKVNPKGYLINAIKKQLEQQKKINQS